MVICSSRAPSSPSSSPSSSSPPPSPHYNCHELRDAVATRARLSKERSTSPTTASARVFYQSQHDHRNQAPLAEDRLTAVASISRAISGNRAAARTRGEATCGCMILTFADSCQGCACEAECTHIARGLCIPCCANTCAFGLRRLHLVVSLQRSRRFSVPLNPAQQGPRV